MTFQNAVKDFATIYCRFSDYWQMQLTWTSYLDWLFGEHKITERQRNNWGNPCTPETFKKWSSRWYGLRSEI